MQSKKKKLQNASTEDRKCSFYTKQKTRTGQNLFSSKYKVFKPRKYQTVFHIMIKILVLSFQEGVKLPYYTILWRDFKLGNLAIFLKFYKIKCT